MFVEFGGLAVGVAMHRGLNAEAAQSGSLSKRKREA
jgi:hypothetical protein